jgi:uncharacterized protein
MSDYHEPTEELSERDRNLHRALSSLKEEIEAVDWYHQRVALCQDESLRAVLAHNRDEEIEHACMTLEWLRRNMPGWQQQLQAYLFTEKPITESESEGTGRPAAGAARDDLGLGSLKAEPPREE